MGRATCTLSTEATTACGKIDTNGVITTLAGTGERGYSGDGQLATEAKLDFASGLAVDMIGNVYVAVANRDTGENVVRKIDPGRCNH